MSSLISLTACSTLLIHSITAAFLKQGQFGRIQIREVQPANRRRWASSYDNNLRPMFQCPASYDQSAATIARRTRERQSLGGRRDDEAPV